MEIRLERKSGRECQPTPSFKGNSRSPPSQDTAPPDGAAIARIAAASHPFNRCYRCNRLGMQPLRAWVKSLSRGIRCARNPRPKAPTNSQYTSQLQSCRQRTGNRLMVVVRAAPLSPRFPKTGIGHLSLPSWSGGLLDRNIEIRLRQRLPGRSGQIALRAAMEIP